MTVASPPLPAFHFDLAVIYLYLQKAANYSRVHVPCGAAFLYTLNKNTGKGGKTTKGEKPNRNRLWILKFSCTERTKNESWFTIRNGISTDNSEPQYSQRCLSVRVVEYSSQGLINPTLIVLQNLTETSSLSLLDNITQEKTQNTLKSRFSYNCSCFL